MSNDMQQAVPHGVFLFVPAADAQLELGEAIPMAIIDAMKAESDARGGRGDAPRVSVSTSRSDPATLVWEIGPIVALGHSDAAVRPIIEVLRQHGWEASSISQGVAWFASADVVNHWVRAYAPALTGGAYDEQGRLNNKDGDEV